MSSDHPTKDHDHFKDGLRSTLKAIAQKKDVDINFLETENVLTSTLTERRFRNTSQIALHKTEALSVKNKALSRAHTDSEALRIAYHDKKQHAVNLPSDDKAARLFDALEQARFEALGALQFKGIASNRSRALENLSALRGLDNIENREDVSDADALYMLAYSKFASTELPQNAQKVAKLWEPWIDSHMGKDGLQDLSEKLGNQTDFAQSAREALIKLGYLQVQDTQSLDTENEDADSSNENDEADSAPEEDQQESQSSQQDDMVDDGGQEDSEDTAEQTQTGDLEENEAQDTEETGQRQDTTQETQRREENGLAENKLGTSYQIYTTQFDEIVRASDLADPSELVRLRRLLDKQLTSMQSVISKLANRLQRQLMARQMRHWEFDLEEGVLDSSRLARIVANPYVPLTFKQERETEFKDTVVTLMLDNSGSMRGRPITISALCADILARTLERCKVKVEILGYTTRAWKGGQSRDVWLQNGRPPTPGRLNDVRHIIYKSADQPWRRSKNNLALMLKEGLLKENIDGEALVWGYNRLARRGEARKIMIVISDGAPVDDSTLSVNPSNILETDLKQVINWIETRSDIQLGAIGIGHDVTRHYKNAIKITNAEDLGNALIHHLETLFNVKNT